jgi:hypothetical protein
MAVVYLSARSREASSRSPPSDATQYLALHMKTAKEALRDYPCLLDHLLVIAGANLAGIVSK